MLNILLKLRYILKRTFIIISGDLYYTATSHIGEYPKDDWLKAKRELATMFKKPDTSKDEPPHC